MGRRRESHRRHSELTPEMAFDLAGWGNPAFDSEEERRAAWEEHRDELLARRRGLPGTRPEAYWRYTPGAPRDEHYRRPAQEVYAQASDPDALRVDHDAAWEAQIRFLAARDELREDEVQALADDVAEKATWTSEAQERARARLDAALEGLRKRSWSGSSGHGCAC